MKQTHEYNLSVAEVAEHFDLTPRTVRNHLNSGNLVGVRIRGEWRCAWKDVLSAEKGPLPSGPRRNLYHAPLLTKKHVAGKWRISERTVERWIEEGLPTRNVFGSVRLAPVDLVEWTSRTFGIVDPA